MIKIILKKVHCFVKWKSPLQNSMTHHTHSQKYINTQRHTCAQDNSTQLETVLSVSCWIIVISFVFSAALYFPHALCRNNTKLSATWERFWNMRLPLASAQAARLWQATLLLASLSVWSMLISILPTLIFRSNQREIVTDREKRAKIAKNFFFFFKKVLKKKKTWLGQRLNLSIKC